jgi:pentatricopeptide repeat protein
MTTALNTALGACFKAGQIPAAVQLYDKSIATGIVTADIITYSTLMNTLASGKHAHLTTLCSSYVMHYFYNFVVYILQAVNLPVNATQSVPHCASVTNDVMLCYC